MSTDDKRILHQVSAPEGQDHADFIFFCPGCQCGHGVWTTKRNGRNAIWTFNGSMDKPTFEPSLLIQGTKFSPAGEADYAQWASAGYPDRQGKPFDSVPLVCHSFIRDGMIQFLPDCTHDLAGKTVPMEPF